MTTVLRNMKLVNGEKVDIVLEGRRIAAIMPPNCGSGEVIAEESYVSSGWIDMHVHAFHEFKPYGDNIDEIGVSQGVTTIVDAGSCGADRIGQLYEAGEGAKTQLLSFLNISRIGLERMDELSEPDWLDEQRLGEALAAYPAFIVGLKARISRSVVKQQGIQPLVVARRMADKEQQRMMIHIGTGPPPIEEVVGMLAEGDIITHYLNGKPNNLFDSQGRPLSALTMALGRGVRLDVGHGTASFSFRVAEQARTWGIPLHTISSDIYKSNRTNGPVYSLANVMSKFLYLGYSLREIVDAVTVNAAVSLGRPELAGLTMGGLANLTLFDVIHDNKLLVDSEGQTRMASTYIKPRGAVINGSYFAC